MQNHFVKPALGRCPLGTAYTASGTSKTGEVRYRAFGATRFISGTTPTSYRYTGQREESSLGLYYYGARWYDPSLGRFVQADTIVPNPGDPQAYDRYAYVNNNPLKYTDPSGHCPAPASKSGNVICIDLFISTDRIIFGTGEGDGRSFDPDSDPSKSRAYIYLNLDENGKLLSVSPPTINPSCTIAGCYGPYYGPQHNSFEVQQNPETFDITVKWHLTNGVSSFFLEEGRQMQNTASQLSDHTRPEMMRGTASLTGAGVAIPSIDGELTLSVDAAGDYRLTHLDRDPYPSLEIYQYQDGRLRNTIAQRPERGAVGNLGPIIWLNPLAPNDRLVK